MKQSIVLMTTTLLLLSPVLAVDYRIDSVHSSILFKAKRMDVVNVYGRFNEFSGSLSVDDQNPANSSIQLEIQTASIDSNSQRRDDHLRSPDFFNATQFPTISFTSTSIRKTGDTSYAVTGNLTMHGVTKSITAEVTKTGAGEQRGRATIGFETMFTVHRSEFGMNYMVPNLSDEIAIIFALRGVAQ